MLYHMRLRYTIRYILRIGSMRSSFRQRTFSLRFDVFVRCSDDSSSLAILGWQYLAKFSKCVLPTCASQEEEEEEEEITSFQPHQAD
jgi:hypothetical protein